MFSIILDFNLLIGCYDDVKMLYSNSLAIWGDESGSGKSVQDPDPVFARSSDPDQDPWLLLVIKELFKITLECQFHLDACWNRLFAKPFLSLILDFFYPS
jgi:hypothetical protein